MREALSASSPELSVQPDKELPMPRNRSLPAMTILAAGCGGFIGSHLLDQLLAREGVRVIGWDPSTDKIDHLLGHSGLEMRLRALAGKEAFDQFRADAERADVIINLAAICNPSQYNTEPLKTIYANFVECYQVVEIASELKKPLIHFSTSEVYGRTVASYIDDDTYDRPELYMLDADHSPMLLGSIGAQRWTYACAKQLFERLIYAYHKEHGLDFAIIRPFNFFGPRMDYLPGIEGTGTPRVLACFVSALLRGLPLQLVDGGHARRTITSVHDAVDSVLGILERPDVALNHFYNIGNPANEVTMAELADEARRVYAEITGDPGYLDHPVETVSSAAFYGDGYEDCDRRMLNIEREMALLDWRPERSLRDILTETLGYYHELYGQRPGLVSAAQ
jgi:UDP-apiose/xylose synthase